jgi:hypothetical protein
LVRAKVAGTVLPGVPNQAQQSSVDEKSKNGVPHKKDKQRKNIEAKVREHTEGMICG